MNNNVNVNNNNNNNNNSNSSNFEAIFTYLHCKQFYLFSQHVLLYTCLYT